VIYEAKKDAIWNATIPKKIPTNLRRYANEIENDDVKMMSVRDFDLDRKLFEVWMMIVLEKMRWIRLVFVRWTCFDLSTFH
jgi:hypothetical protein